MPNDPHASSPGDTYIAEGHQLPPPHERPHRSPIVNAIIWLVILLGFGLLFWVILRQHPQTKPAAAGPNGAGGTVAVTATTVYRGDIGVHLDSIGTVTPVYTDAITSQITGLVNQVLYHEGQLVRRGQLLIQIDPRPYQALLVESQGSLQRDENLLAQARMDAQRYEDAWKRNAIARQVVEDQQKLVLQLEGTVKLDQGTVAYNQVQLSYCSLFAPISGRVGLRLIDPGNVVQANSTNPLVVITQLQPITVVFTIPEDSVATVEQEMHKGHPLHVEALDRSNQSSLDSGTLETTDNQIDTTTGTLKLRAIFANRKNTLFPNLFVNARLLVKTLHNMTLMANDAIQQNGDTSFVYVIRNGVAHQQNVKIGVTDNGITVVDGLNPGDVVADSSFEKLQDGARVRVVPHRSLRPASNPEANAP